MTTKRDLLPAACRGPGHNRFSASGPGGQRRGPVFRAKDIAEAGYIYGLPIVMNYGVMYEFVIDKNSGQYKAPFNTIANEARVFTYKDTAVVTPNSDTPYSMLWLDLRAEPMVISVPAVDPKRYYSVQLMRRQYLQLRLYRQPRHGQRGGRLPGRRARLERRQRPTASARCSSPTTEFGLTIFRTQLFDADDMDNVKKVQAGYKAQPLSALSQAARACRRARDRLPEVQQGTGQDRTSSSSSISRCSSRRPSRTRCGSANSWRASASVPARPSTSRTSRSRTRRRSCSAWQRASARSTRRPRPPARPSMAGALASPFGDAGVLPRRLAAPGDGRAGGHLRQRRGRGHVSDDPVGCRREPTRRLEAQLHHHLRGRTSCRRSTPSGRSPCMTARPSC